MKGNSMKRIIFSILAVIVLALCVGYVRNASRQNSSIVTAESSAAVPASEGTEKRTREPAVPAQQESAAAALTSNAPSSTPATLSAPDKKGVPQPPQIPR